MKRVKDYLNKEYLKRNLKKRVLFPLRIIDLIDWIIIRRKNSLTHPSRLLWGGPSRTSLAFYKWGLGDLSMFIETCHLKPDFKVLDVGCGIGRCAIAFSGFLEQNGSYVGFDSHKGAIDMCKKISSKYPNFNFTFADVYNEFYNQEGKINHSEFNLPYKNESMDFVFLISVFTHMIPEVFKHYLSEISRVLKVNGTCFISFLLGMIIHLLP